jgi:hypothetical protein
LTTDLQKQTCEDSVGKYERNRQGDEFVEKARASERLKRTGEKQKRMRMQGERHKELYMCTQ